MSTSASATVDFLHLVETHLAKVYHLCMRMTLDPRDAAEACEETFCRAYAGHHSDDTRTELWLLKIAAHVLDRHVSQTPEVTFELLDETLRSEATRTGEVASIINPQREFLLWELKQGCMTAVVNCLSPGERVAFVMSAVLDLSDEDASLVLNIKPSAFKVRLSRARKKVADYLAPRCEHIDPRNPCHCPSRIGVALRKGFIAPPAHAEVTLRPLPRFEEEPRVHDAVAIYQTLPEPEAPASLRERIQAKIQSGEWERPRSEP